MNRHRLFAARPLLAGSLAILLAASLLAAAPDTKNKPAPAPDAKGTAAPDAPGAKGKPKPLAAKKPAPDPEYARFGIYAKTAPRPAKTEPVDTTLPLALRKGDRIALVGNTLFDRQRDHAHIEALLHQRFPQHELVIRNLAWSADTVDLQPRPDNFADTDQHLVHEQADVVLAAFGFNESFAGERGLPAFRQALGDHLAAMKAKAFNGKTGPRLVLVSPIACENIKHVPAADLNNARVKAYTEAMRAVAAEQRVGFAEVFTPTLAAMADPATDLTINGVHLNAKGHAVFAAALHQALFNEPAPQVDEPLRRAAVDLNRQFLRRFRPLNSFYYTGDRNKQYGYLDFLPAMQAFDVKVANRDRRLWAMAQGKPVPAKVDDGNVPALPQVDQSRAANEWLSAKDEQAAFKVDPRFEVNLFAGEERFPDIANPIQIRWDARGRMWVSCSTTYPHVYPGQEPRDKIVVLEDTDGDGKADKSSVFAEGLHIPLSFEFGDGGVYVSEQPHLTFLKDTDGDGKADVHEVVLTGFGTEDSHHALHDFVWTPEGDLIFRESIFHHSQIETPYGPVRQLNSGWFRFDPRTHRLDTFGTYPSTNPWGVTFDDWGQHVASHPIYAAAFHAIDPDYPRQFPAPAGMQAYSGTCGQEFFDSAAFPASLRGAFAKARYKPTNRIEILRWVEGRFGYEEKYEGDLVFSSNLSFIPVDLRFGPRGDLYICDWYNPVKGHAQYALRDERRSRNSGRIWRITAKGMPTQDPPRIAGAPVGELLDLLKRPEHGVRYWARQELRERDPAAVAAALAKWTQALSPADPRHRHHQVEALWARRWVASRDTALLREVLACDVPLARAAALRMLRHWHAGMPDAADLLRKAANDAHAIVRMEAAIAASYIGSRSALEAMLDVAKHPRDGHLAYAFRCALESRTLRPLWQADPALVASVGKLLRVPKAADEFAEKSRTPADVRFDAHKDLKRIDLSCLPERMKFSADQVVVLAGQPVKLVFTNADATDHNFVLVRPGALEEVGTAGNDMAKDPRNAAGDFVPLVKPLDKRALILQHTPLIGPTRAAKVHVLRFEAPAEPGVYPYLCTFPGHWIAMNGELVVVKDLKDVDKVLAARKKPTVVRQWTYDELAKDAENLKGRDLSKGMAAFAKAQCVQCHRIDGHGSAIGPDLTKVAEKYKGPRLLKEVIEPSTEINEQYRTHTFHTHDGETISGVVAKEDAEAAHVVQNLLLPQKVTKVLKRDIGARSASKLSAMPTGLLMVLTKDEILDLLAFVEAGGLGLPGQFQHKHGPGHGDGHGHGE